MTPYPALRLAASALLAASLVGCNVLTAAAEVLLDTGVGLSGHRLTVVNNCVGPDTTVNFYLDGRYQGAVTYSRSFGGLTTGAYTLLARGTGGGGSSFQRTLYISSDTRWTLCP